MTSAYIDDIVAVLAVGSTCFVIGTLVLMVAWRLCFGG